MYSETITQRLAFPNPVQSQSLSSSRASTNAVDMQQNHRAFFVVSIGAMTGGSISCWLQESADNSSWTANDTAGAFSNSAASNVSQTGITASNTLVTFEVRADQLTTGKRYVRLQIKETLGTTSPICVIAFGDEGNHKPNNVNNGTQLTTANQNVVA